MWAIAAILTFLVLLPTGNSLRFTSRAMTKYSADISLHNDVLEFQPSRARSLKGTRLRDGWSPSDQPKYARNDDSFDEVEDILESLQQDLPLTMRVRNLKAIASTRNRNIKHHRNVPEILFPLLEQMVDEVDGETLPDLMWSLGNLGFSLQVDKHKPLIYHLLKRTSEVARTLNSNKIATCFLGFRTLGVYYPGLFPRIKDAILDMLDAAFVHSSRDSLSGLTVGNLLHCQARIGLRWKDIRPATRIAILEVIEMLLKSEDISNFANMIIYNLGNHGIDIVSLNPEMRSSIFSLANIILDGAAESSSKSKGSQMSSSDADVSSQGTSRSSTPNNRRSRAEQEVANTVYALGKMNVKITNIPPRTFSALLLAIEATIPTMSAQEVSITAYR